MNAKTLRHVAGAIAILLALAAKPASAAELDRLVADACHKPVVLLGEDAGHGSGATLATKVDLVERLVDDCGFDAVFFESQVYDFVALEDAFAAKTATADQLADAIGGLWSTTAESDRLVAYLFGKAAAGQVQLRGLDPQVSGATNAYTQRQLGARLASVLASPRREQCATEIRRHAGWLYDDANPFDDAAQARLQACADGIVAHEGDATVDAAMARNFVQYLAMANDRAIRDHAMYDNFAWHRARLPKDAKVIVWTTTVHAAKAGVPGGVRPMGAFLHEALGDDAFVVGFSALAGSHGRPNQPPVVLDAAAPDSLEQRAFAGSDAPIRYLDRAQLQAWGPVAGRALDYGDARVRDWAAVLDGVVVLREERPPQYVRPAVPRQEL
jgi:erythromycin esterase-like protein